MQWLRKLWEEASDDGGVEEYKRDGRRRTTQDRIDIKLAASGMAPQDKMSGIIRDVTPNSLGITCRTKLPIGNILVKLSESDSWSSMRVVHCTQTIGGYKIGLSTSGR